MNFDISRRIAEDDVVDSVSSAFFQKFGHWPSEFCNRLNMCEDENNIESNNTINTFSHTDNITQHKRPRFHIGCTTETSYNDGEETEILTLSIDWGGKSREPLKNYNIHLLHKIAARLYLGSPNIGGSISTDIKIPGFTEIKIDNVIYRCHPYYSDNGPWFDWALFDWEGFEDLVPAQIMMIIDFENIEINYEYDENPDDTVTQNKYNHLTQEKRFVLVKSQI